MDNTDLQTVLDFAKKSLQREAQEAQSMINDVQSKIQLIGRAIESLESQPVKRKRGRPLSKKEFPSATVDGLDIAPEA